MIPRRGLLGSATLAVLGMMVGNARGSGRPDARADAAGDVGETAGESQDSLSERGLTRITEAITQLRNELQTQRQFTELASIREAQKQYLRANAKFPDFIEVGPDLWFAVHDWHVRWQQPLTLGRDGLGRYTVLLNPTTVILRTDTTANFIGQPYDSR